MTGTQVQDLHSPPGRSMLRVAAGNVPVLLELVRAFFPTRKGKPTGDGTRFESGRAMSLEGSTPSPSASCVPLAERQRCRASNPVGRVRFPQGTLIHSGIGQWQAAWL